MKYALLVCSIFAVYCFAQIKENPVTSTILKAYVGDTTDVKVLVPATPARMIPQCNPGRINLRIGRDDWYGYIVYHKPVGKPIVAIDSVKVKMIFADSADILVKSRVQLINPDIDTIQ